MLTETTSDQEIKLCCATFYQSDSVRLLLGDVFHPGGLDLTYRLGEALGLGPGDHALDLACGRGASAVHLAKRFGCRVTGVDFGAENVAAAQAHAAENGVAHLTTFRQGDAEGLPFDDESFDAVMSECSFCTFPNQVTAAAEMMRVLKRGGRLGLTDMTVSGPLPDDIQGLGSGGLEGAPLAWVACVAGAGTPDDYVATLRGAGLTGFLVEDQRSALLELVNGVRSKLLGIELIIGLGKLDRGDGLTQFAAGLDLNEGKRLVRRAIDLIHSGALGYALITARKA